MITISRTPSHPIRLNASQVSPHTRTSPCLHPIRVLAPVLWSWVVAALLPAFAAESTTNAPLLTLDRIFDASEFDGESAGQIFWRKQGGGYYAWEKAASGSGKDFVLVDPASGSKEILVPAHAFQMPGGGGSLSSAHFELSQDESKMLLFTNTKKVWRANTRGDYWVLDMTSRELRKLGGDAPASSLMFAKFSPDGSRVGYVRANNLYVQNLRDMSIQALTSDGSPTLINGTFDWVYEEELYLRDGFRWSPDGASIAYWQLDSRGVREFQLINNTDSFYPRLTPIPYPKTGEQNSSARVGVVPVNGGETRWMAIPGDPRNHYLARMSWASNSTELVVQQFNRPQNTNLVLLANATTGETRNVLTESDRTWVENDNPIHWIDHGKKFLWSSERDGWTHLYKVSRDGQQISRVTKGDFDVIDLLKVDEASGYLYYIASPDNPTQRYLYRTKLDGGKAERLTPTDASALGTHSYQLSPDARWAVHTFSNHSQPPVTDLISLPDHKSIRVLEENKKLKEKLAALRPTSTEFFRVDIGNQIALDGWSIKPPEFDSSKKYPVVFHVYGEPAGQTVTDSWRGRNHLWHTFLAQKGYIVMSVDNRGTPAPRGREWRRALHKSIGIVNTADQAKAVQALLSRWSYLDPKRVGIWGWSGGGSSTLNAMFQYPDLYKVGISVAPVPNQRYYDSIYQERYMGLPEDNVEGYRKGSPLTHARNLKGPLLIIHGTGDDNVHYQGVEALINELVAYNKPFSMMSYPNRSHSISEGPNTTRHLYDLMTRFLDQHLPR